MRTIPAAIKALLKTRSMIGTNGPACELEFTDKAGGYSEPAWTVEKTPRNSASKDMGGGNWVTRTDGKILATYYNYTDRTICLSYVDSEDDIKNTSDCFVTNESVFATLDVNTTTGNKRCRSWLFWTASGKLQLYIYEPGRHNVAYYLKVYQSTTGNGDDFALLTTIDTVTPSKSYTYSGRLADIGGVTQLSSGRIIVNWGRPKSGTGGLVTAWIYGYYVSWSDDDGATWSGAYIYWYNNSDSYAQYQCSIGIANTRIFCSIKEYASNYNDGKKVYYSDDEGATWTPTAAYVKAGGDPNGTGMHGTYSPGDGYTYMFWFNASTQWYFDIYRRANTDSFDETDPFSLGVGNTWPDLLLTDKGHNAYDAIFMTDVTLWYAGNNSVAAPDELWCYMGERTLLPGGVVQASSVRVSKDIVSNSNRMQATIPNVNPDDKTEIGFYSPESGVSADWDDEILPGANVTLKLGYSTDLVQVFKGQVDDVNVGDTEGDCDISIDCRDDAWMILDKVVNDGSSHHYISYSSKTIEYIVNDLLTKAGFTDITTEATGITITSKTFDRVTYADALEWCMTMSGFEIIVDDEGAVTFYRPNDRQPEATDESHVLNGTTPVTLTEYPVVTSSIQVYSGAGKTGTLYSSTTDYLVVEGDHDTAWTIERRVGSTIPDGGTVYANYVYAAYVFQEGYDIFNLGYKYSRRDIYAKIVVTGKSSTGTIVSGIYSVATPSNYGVPDDKIMYVDDETLDTAVKCQDTADQLGADMIKKYREATFGAVGVPWIQVGDCVQVIETSSGISEIYRILTMDIEASPDGMVMTMRTYHYGYSPA